MNGNDGQRDQTGGYDRMHDEYQPMPRRCIRAFDGALDENAILVAFADDSGHGLMQDGRGLVGFAVGCRRRAAYGSISVIQLGVV